MPIDYTTPIGQVRLLISDVDEATPTLSDDQVAGYLIINGGTTVEAPIWVVRRAAADALDAIAVSEALVSKVIRSQDLQTDGAKLADALRKQAEALRRQADVDEVSDGGGVVDVVEFTPYPPRQGEAAEMVWW